ncbi:MAG: right-handed parallel beta-helix repeat-containing protein [Nocardioidaceae bacterium]
MSLTMSTARQLGTPSPITAARPTPRAVASAGAMLVLGLVGLMAPSASADAPLVVDDDRAQCPHASHTSIQSAVAAARPGDKVVVCEGTYHETVTVTTDDVRLVADGEGGVVVNGERVRQRGFVLAAVRGVTIQGFTVRDHLESGINLSAGADHNVVRHNVTSGNGFGIQLASAGSGNAVVHNTSTDNALAGISNVSSEGTTIAHNVTSQNGRNGIVAARPHGSYAALSATLAHNRSSDNGTAGIALVHGGGSTVSHNHLSGNAQDGIILHESFDNVIEHNRSTTNGLDGIGVKDHPGMPLSARNVIRSNQVLDNAEHDCHDESVGAGTAGTANVWEHNHAETQNRPGLCRRPT